MAIEYNKKYTYKNLCKALNIQPKSSGYKTQQLKELGRKYEIKVDKRGNYTILKEYDEIEQIEKQKYNNNKKYLEPMIYTLLNFATSNVVEFDMKQLMEALAVCNSNFFIAKWNIQKSDEIIVGENQGNLDLFIKESDGILRRIIKDVLKDMQDKCLIEMNEIPNFATKYKGGDGKWYTKNCRIDDETEYPIFLEAKRQALESVGVEKMSELNFFQHIEVKRFIEQKLKEELGIDYYYYSYRLILNKKGINDLLLKNYDGVRLSFNKQIMDKIYISKNNTLVSIDNKIKQAYIDALISTNTSLDLKNRLGIDE